MPTETVQRLAPVPRDLALKATALLTGCMVALYVCSPLVAPVLLVGCLLTSLYWADQYGPISWGAFGAIAALVVWFAISVSWSPDKRNAISAVVLYVIVCLAAMGTMQLAPWVPKDARRAVAVAFVLGVGFAVWLALEEALSGHFVRRALNTYVPMTRPQTVQLRTDTGWIAAVQSYATNKNMAVCVLMAWPALLISRFVAQAPWHKTARWLTAAALGVAIFMSEHEASKLALAVSALVFVIARWSRSLAFPLLVIGWLAATLAIVPVSLLVYNAGVHQVESLQYSGRHRVVIWGHTSQRVLERPLRGYGLASTRVLDEMAPTERVFVPGTTIPQGTNMHSHNVFLQTWHETGGIGALLLMLAGLPVLAWLRRRSDQTAPYLFAAFTASVCMASLSWSLVATWYVATYGLVVVWSRFADLFATEGAAIETVPAAPRTTTVDAIA